MPRPLIRVDPASHLPLTPQVFQILLSVSDQPLHGYAIIADVDSRTSSEITLTPSTLYDALARLVDHGLITELDEPPDHGVDHDKRRRYYVISQIGRSVARLEAGRLQRLLEMARDKKLAPAGRGPSRR